MMSTTLRDLSIGQISLPPIINQDVIYVDKTSYIYDLVKTKGFYFITRPRAFGKSLLVSTLSHIFQGNRELFKSLAIASTDYSWETYPIVLISFATMAIQSAEVLRDALNKTVQKIATRYGVELEKEPTLGMQFQSLILSLSKINKVVILIDEYDATILKNIEHPEEAEACRDVLAEFFSALKDVEVDEQIRFVFITGITKFSKTSIFSGLNLLQDLTLDPRAAKLLGYTTDEISSYFKDHIQSISDTTDMPVHDILETIKHWYNGYQFVNPLEVPDAKVYNPYSVMLYLQNKRFDNYWFDTGTPTFLIKLLKKEDYDVTNLEGAQIHWDETKSYDIEDIELIPLLMETGYLTIDTYDPITENFTLTFPNEEVKTSFFQIILLSLTKSKKHRLSPIIVSLKKALADADMEAFFHTLDVYFSQIPYHMNVASEKHYQAIFFGLLVLIGADVRVEEPTNNGRIDAVIETNTHVFILEFKLNHTAESALDQIETKEYYKKYLLSNKKIILCGIQFDKDAHTVTKWLTKEVTN